MKRALRGRLAALVLGTLALSGAPLALQAQEEPPRQELERRVRQAFANRVRTALQLSDQETRSLVRLVREFEVERRALAGRTRILNDRVTQFLRDGGGAEEANELLEERVGLQRAEADLFEAEQRALLEILSPAQVVRFDRLRQELNQRLRNARRRTERPGNPGTSPPEDA